MFVCCCFLLEFCFLFILSAVGCHERDNQTAHAVILTLQNFTHSYRPHMPSSSRYKHLLHTVTDHTCRHPHVTKPVKHSYRPHVPAPLRCKACHTQLQTTHTVILTLQNLLHTVTSCLCFYVMICRRHHHHHHRLRRHHQLVLEEDVTSR